MSPTTARPDWAGRLETLRQSCASHGVDALVVSASVNITYLTGFSGSSGLFVVSADDEFLLVDGRYQASVRASLAAGTLGPASLTLEAVATRYDLTLGALIDRLGRLGVRRVGFEAGDVTVATLKRWQHAMPAVDWRPTEALVESQRRVKDEWEIAIFRRAADRLSDVARALAQWVRLARTERDVARDIDAAMERAGFDHPAFPTIVAAGSNSAYPHARPTDHRLARGELVVLDFGGVLDGYCVDLTRTAAVGRVDDSAAALFAAVEASQVAALASVRAGVPAAEVDQAARQVLEARGLGNAFLHATGHGLGLEVHEAPRLARAEAGSPGDVLQAGMVCTVEPGAYVEGLGGVRLEDDVLVTASGCETLTNAPRHLLVV